MPANRDIRQLVSVAITGGIQYGFLTPEVHEVLGHVLVPAAFPATLVIGANSPKPGRATKNFATGSKSSFVATAAVAAARAAGWKISRSKRRQGATTARSSARYVEVNGIKYGWSMPVANITAIGTDLSVLGVEPVTGNDIVVYGASYPKPPRAKKVVGLGTAAETSYSTFVAPTALDNLPSDFVLAGSGNYSAA
jgi:hypothetical protein